jgi:hypothetical protein
MQIAPVIDAKKNRVYVRPGDVNLGRMAAAAGYKLRGKGGPAMKGGK